MSDIKLFRFEKKGVTELQGTSVNLEKSLQTLIEQNLESLLGVRFLASEYATGKTHGGRIDTLGIDENKCPVIIEYKRAINENVVNQGLFYLDWLLDHKAELQLLVQRRLGIDEAKDIDWSGCRLLCIAGDFTRYDTHAVAQINRNIELIRYKRYGDDLLLLDLVNATTAEGSSAGAGTGQSVGGKSGAYKTVSQYLEEADDTLRDIFESLKAFLLGLGDDVQMSALKFYFAFKRFKNFACVEVHNKEKSVRVYLKVDPTTIKLVKGFTRDVGKIGHLGTGDLEVTLKSPADLEHAKPLLLQSYEAS
jgi:predicted transport protein